MPRLIILADASSAAFFLLFQENDFIHSNSNDFHIYKIYIL